MINNKKVNEGYSTDTTDIEGMLDAILDFIFVYSYEDACASGIIDEETSDFEEDAVDEFREDLINKDTKLAEFLYDIIDKLEPGERYDGKIDDILDYLEGYEVGDRLYPMSTKNEAMEKVNESDFDKWCIKNIGPKVNAFKKELNNKIKSGKIDEDDLSGLVSYVVGEVFEIVTEAVKPYVEGNKKTNESLDEEYKGVDLNDYKDLIYVVLDAVDTLNIELGSETNKRARQLLSKLEHDEYAQRIDKDTEDWSDEDYDAEYEYKVGKREKEIDDLYDEYGRPRNESLDEDDYKADDDFVDGEAKTDDNMNESLAGFKKLPVKSFERATNNSVPQTAELEDEVADESFAHDDSM